MWNWKEEQEAKGDNEKMAFKSRLKYNVDTQRLEHEHFSHCNNMS